MADGQEWCATGINDIYQHLNGFGSLFIFADDVQILFTGAVISLTCYREKLIMHA